MQFTYPEDYPCNCPPAPFEENPGFYYRFIKNDDKITSEDFDSPFKLGKRKDLVTKDPCGRRAISILSDLNDAKRILSLYRGLPRNILKLHLNGNHGIIHRVPKEGHAHFHWWIPKGVDPTTFATNEIRVPPEY